MNSPFSAAVIVVLLAAGGFAPPQTLAKKPEPAPQSSVAKLSPFYCDAGALTPALRTRHFDVLGPALIAKRTAVRELRNGYEIQFPSDAQTYQELVEYVDGERVCCPFFDIEVRVLPEGGPLLVSFTGRPGTKQFIQGDGAGWISPVVARK